MGFREAKIPTPPTSLWVWHFYIPWDTPNCKKTYWRHCGTTVQNFTPIGRYTGDKLLTRQTISRSAQYIPSNTIAWQEITSNHNISVIRPWMYHLKIYLARHQPLATFHQTVKFAHFTHTENHMDRNQSYSQPISAVDKPQTSAAPLNIYCIKYTYVTLTTANTINM